MANPLPSASSSAVKTASAKKKGKSLRARTKRIIVRAIEADSPTDPNAPRLPVQRSSGRGGRGNIKRLAPAETASAIRPAAGPTHASDLAAVEAEVMRGRDMLYAAKIKNTGRGGQGNIARARAKSTSLSLAAEIMTQFEEGKRAHELAVIATSVDLRKSKPQPIGRTGAGNIEHPRQIVRARAGTSALGRQGSLMRPSMSSDGSYTPAAYFPAAPRSASPTDLGALSSDHAPTEGRSGSDGDAMPHGSPDLSFPLPPAGGAANASLWGKLVGKGKGKDKGKGHAVPPLPLFRASSMSTSPPGSDDRGSARSGDSVLNLSGSRSRLSLGSTGESSPEIAGVGTAGAVRRDRAFLPPLTLTIGARGEAPPPSASSMHSSFLSPFTPTSSSSSGSASNSNPASTSTRLSHSSGLSSFYFRAAKRPGSSSSAVTGGATPLLPPPRAPAGPRSNTAASAGTVASTGARRFGMGMLRRRTRGSTGSVETATTFGAVTAESASVRSGADGAGARPAELESAYASSPEIAHHGDAEADRASLAPTFGTEGDADGYDGELDPDGDDDAHAARIEPFTFFPAVPLLGPAPATGQLPEYRRTYIAPDGSMPATPVTPVPTSKRELAQLERERVGSPSLSARSASTGTSAGDDAVYGYGYAHLASPASTISSVSSIGASPTLSASPSPSVGPRTPPTLALHEHVYAGSGSAHGQLLQRRRLSTAKPPPPFRALDGILLEAPPPLPGHEHGQGAEHEHAAGLGALGAPFEFAAPPPPRYSAHSFGLALRDDDDASIVGSLDGSEDGHAGPALNSDLTLALLTRGRGVEADADASAGAAQYSSDGHSEEYHDAPEGSLYEYAEEDELLGEAYGFAYGYETESEYDREREEEAAESSGTEDAHDPAMSLRSWSRTEEEASDAASVAGSAFVAPPTPPARPERALPPLPEGELVQYAPAIEVSV